MLGALVVVLLTGLVAVGLAAATWRSSAADAFVTRTGTRLSVDGDPYRFVGFNLYDAAATDSYSCNPTTRLDDEALDEAMRAVAGAGGTVVRFWATQPYTSGAEDFSGVDRVIDAARRHGLRVMPVLEDGQGNCGSGPSRVPLGVVADSAWYTTGYRSPYGHARLSFRDYAEQMARHYRNEPAIVAWSLVNEAETTARDDQGQTVLVDFARDVGGVVQQADPHHLVTLGTQGNGVPGASGADFADIYALPEMDLTEVHDWGYWGSDTEALPGADEDGSLPTEQECRALDARIACSFTIARALDKPIVVGEAGIEARSASASQRRAALFEPKIRAAFEAGASGYLIWQLNVENTDGYAVLIGDGDPLYAVLSAAARRWATGG